MRLVLTTVVAGLATELLDLLGAVLLARVAGVYSLVNIALLDVPEVF